MLRAAGSNSLCWQCLLVRLSAWSFLQLCVVIWPQFTAAFSVVGQLILARTGPAIGGRCNHGEKGVKKRRAEHRCDEAPARCSAGFGSVAPAEIAAALSWSPLCHNSTSFPVRYKRLVWILLNPETTCGRSPLHLALGWKQSARGNVKMYNEAGGDDVLHQSVSQQTLSQPSGCWLRGCLAFFTMYRCWGGGGSTRRDGEEEVEEGLWCHRPGLHARPDGVMGTASCGLNYNAQWWERLVLFFFWDTRLNPCVEPSVFRDSQKVLCWREGGEACLP